MASNHFGKHAFNAIQKKKQAISTPAGRHHRNGNIDKKYLKFYSKMPIIRCEDFLDARASFLSDSQLNLG